MLPAWNARPIYGLFGVPIHQTTTVECMASDPGFYEFRGHDYAVGRWLVEPSCPPPSDQRSRRRRASLLIIVVSAAQNSERRRSTWADADLLARLGARVVFALARPPPPGAPTTLQGRRPRRSNATRRKRQRVTATY